MLNIKLFSSKVRGRLFYLSIDFHPPLDFQSAMYLKYQTMETNLFHGEINVRGSNNTTVISVNDLNFTVKYLHNIV